MHDDFIDLGSYRQVSRALKQLVTEGSLVKLGKGLYAKAYISPYSVTPLPKAGFDQAAREALDRMGVEWEAGSAERAYNVGETQQVPVQNVVRLRSRLRRHVSYQNRELYFEGGINAR